MQGVRLMYNVLCLISMILFFLFWAIYQNMEQKPTGNCTDSNGDAETTDPPPPAPKSKLKSLKQYGEKKNNATLSQEIELLKELRLNDFKSFNKTVELLKLRIEDLKKELAIEREACNQGDPDKPSVFCAEYHKNLLDKIEFLEEMQNGKKKMLDEYTFEEDECLLNLTNLGSELENLRNMLDSRESECAVIQQNLLNDVYQLQSENAAERTKCQLMENNYSEKCLGTQRNLDELNKNFLVLQQNSRNERNNLEKIIENLRIEQFKEHEKWERVQERLTSLEEILNKDLGECNADSIEDKVVCLLTSHQEDQTKCSTKLIQAAQKINELEIRQINEDMRCNSTISVLKNDLKALTKLISHRHF